jgi:hypothetical protein
MTAWIKLMQTLELLPQKKRRECEDLDISRDGQSLFGVVEIWHMEVSTSEEAFGVRKEVMTK